MEDWHGDDRMVFTTLAPTRSKRRACLLERFYVLLVSASVVTYETACQRLVEARLDFRVGRFRRQPVLRTAQVLYAQSFSFRHPDCDAASVAGGLR